MLGKKKILFLVFVLLSLFGLKYVYDMHINHNFEIQKFCLKQYVQLYVLDYNEFY